MESYLNKRRGKEMSNDLNRVIIIGRLTRDAELKSTQSGTALCNLSIANNEKYGDKENVSYFEAVMWGKGAEALTQYLTKGKKIAVEGRLQQSRWDDKDGGKRSKVVIKVEQVQFLDVKKSDDNAKQESSIPEFEPRADNPFGGDSDSSGIPF